VEECVDEAVDDDVLSLAVGERGGEGDMDTGTEGDLGRLRWA